MISTRAASVWGADRTRAIVLTLLIACLCVPVVSPTALATTCSPPQQNGFVHVAGGHHVSAARNEVWKETNGAPGIQIRSFTCADGRVIPPDQCVVLNQAAGAVQIVGCIEGSVAAALP